MSLVDSEDVVHNEAGEKSVQPNQTPESGRGATSEFARKAAEKILAAKARTYSFPLSQDARADLNITGDITTDDLDTLRDYVEITIKALSRKAKTES